MNHPQICPGIGEQLTCTCCPLEVIAADPQTRAALLARAGVAGPLGNIDV